MSEQLKHKLQHFEVPPPPGVWNNISREINQNDPSFAQKMYYYEYDPPPGVWENIVNSLINYKHHAQAPPSTLNKSVYKMAAAAAIFGVIVLGGWYFFNNSNLRKQQYSPNIAELNPENKVIGDKNKTLDTNSTDSFKHLQIAAASDYTFTKGKKSNHDKRRKLRNAIVKNVRTIGNELAIMIAAKPIRNERGDIIQDVDLMNSPGDKYIDITGPNGEQTKISSKFINGLLYLNESAGIEEYEGYFDKSFLESIMWKSRFHDWRNKIIQTSFIPSSTNFLDILEFKELLKDTDKH